MGFDCEKAMNRAHVLMPTGADVFMSKKLRVQKKNEQVDAEGKGINSASKAGKWKGI